MNNKKSVLLFSGIVVVILVGTAAGILTAVHFSENKKHEKQNLKAAEVLSEKTADRAALIGELFQRAEQKLTEYSQADEITALLKDPENNTLAEKAQQYTEIFAEGIADNEGIYTADYDTCILAHSQKAAVGVVSRTNQEHLQAFHDALESANGGIYNAGVMISPASDAPVIAMYQEISDNGKPLGFTGIGLKGDRIIETEQILSEAGVLDPVVSLIDTDTQKYIYNGSTEHFNEAVTDDDLLALCSGQNPEESGTLSDGSDEQHPLTVYRCIPEYHLLLLLEENAS